MKNTIIKKSITWLLVVTILLSVFSSCVKKLDESSDPAGNTQNEITAQNPENTPATENDDGSEPTTDANSGGNSSGNNNPASTPVVNNKTENNKTDNKDKDSSKDKDKDKDKPSKNPEEPTTNTSVEEPTTEGNGDNGGASIVNNRYYLIKYGYPDSMSKADKDATYFPDERLLPAGELIYAIPVPQREGYIFSGWYYDSDLAMMVPVDAVVKGNVTLYPKMVPSEDSASELSKSAVNYVSVIDADVTHKVIVKSPDAETVKSGLSLISVSEGNEKKDFTVKNNGDGTFTVQPVGGMKAGKTYQYCAIDREKGIESDGRVPSDDEYVLFVYDGEVQSKEIRFYNIFTTKEEVNNLRIDDEVKFLDFDNVENFGMSEAAGLYTVRMSRSGEVALTDNTADGTFTYDGKLEIGEIVAVYDGEVNEEERTIEDGDVAYIKITAKNGNVYSYVSAKAEAVVFLPDVIPVAKSEDTDNNENTITVKNSVLDFKTFENQEVLNGKTKVNVDDFVALYDGVLGETKSADYGRITKLEKGKEYTVITFVPVTTEELQNALDTYVVNGIDMSLAKSELGEIEDEILEQAIDSNFSEDAALYMAENVLGIENAKLGESYPLTKEQMSLFGMDVEAGNLMWQVKINPPDVRADITTRLKKVTQVNNATGLRVEFGVTIPVGLELVENGMRVIESYNLDLYVTFEQEVAFNTRFSVDVKWDNFLYIVWWICDVRVDAGFEMGTYTGVGAIASIYTDKYTQKSYIWNELVEDTDGGAYSSASSIATRLNEMLKDGNLSFFEGKNGQSLADEYAKMLERNVDYVDILAIRLYHIKSYMDPKTHLVNYVLDIELVLSAKLNITMGIGFENLNVKQYTFYMSLFDATATTNVVDKQTPYSNFNFFIMGNLGLRAGVRVTFSVGLISVKLDNLGAMAEVGVYIDMYGFFYFHYDWNGSTRKHNVQSGGGLYTVVGIYLDLDLFGGVLFDLASFTVHLYENEWPIWNSGNQISIVAPEHATYNFRMQGRQDVIDEYYLRMKSMDMKTGQTYGVNVSRGSFDVKITNSEKFTYNKNTGEITVNPEYTDLKLSTQLVFTYKDKIATFSAQPLTITINVEWEKTEPYQRVYFEKLEKETDTGHYYGVLKSYQFLEGSQIRGLPRNLTTSRQGYDFAGWEIRCKELPEYDGKLLSEVNYLEGVVMPKTYITLMPVWVPRNDVPYKINHYVQSAENPAEYELYKQVEYIGSPGSIALGELIEKIIYEDGINIEYYKLPYLFVFEDYIYYGFHVRGDGTTEVSLYYTRDKYQVAFYVNNPDFEYYFEGDSMQVHTLAYGQALPETEYEYLDIPGYKFKGWSTSPDGSTGVMEKLPETMPTLTGNSKYIQYYAIWEGEKRPLKVNYYMIDPYGEYKFVRSENKTVEVGAEIKNSLIYPVNEEGFESGLISDYKIYDYDRVLYTKNHIDSTQGLIADVYYARKYYPVYWDNKDVEYYWNGQQINFPEREKEGYIFLGWQSAFVDDENIYKPGDTMEMKYYGISFVSVFAPKTDIPYVVKHIRADTQGSYESNFAQVEVENFTGTADSKERPKAKNYVGFNSPYESEITIAPDGSTEVIYKYSRKTYNITVDMDGGRLQGRYASSYKYGVGFYLFEENFLATKKGYDFAGFYIEGDETKTPIDSEYWVSGDILLCDDTITFVAIWKEADYEYKVEHYLEDLEGGFVLQQTDCLSGGYEEAVEAAPVEYIGFTFDETMEGTIKEGVISGEETLVLKLYYTRNEYQVNWYGYDKGTLLATTSHKYQQVITVPENLQPTREGYTFEGWNIGAVETTTAGASFNAKDHGVWIANTYNIEFNANGGKGTMESQPFTYDVAQTLSPNSFSRGGYIFIGWSTEANGNVVYNDQAEVINLATSGTVKLYAQWEAGASTEYKVVYYGENLEGNGYEALKTEKYSGATGSAVSASAITFEGFTYDEANADNVMSGNILGDGSLVLKLYYTRNSYNLTFDFNGESMKQSVDGEITGFEIADSIVSVKYGASIAEEIAKLTVGEYAGYTFGGWGEYPETMTAGDLTVTAEWTPITITVTYYPGASWYNPTTTATETVFTYKYGDEIAAPDVEFTAEGYDIAGWVFHSGDGGPGQYPILTGWPLTLVYGYHSGECFIEGNALDLSPFWSNNYTTVNFNSNGGIGAMAAQLFDAYAGALPLNKNKFTHEGYEFVGWNTMQDGSGVAYEDKSYFSADEVGGNEITLYAQWRKIEE